MFFAHLPQAGESSNHDGKRGWRVASALFPPVLTCHWPLQDHVGRRAPNHHARVEQAERILLGAIATREELGKQPGPAASLTNRRSR